MKRQILSTVFAVFLIGFSFGQVAITTDGSGPAASAMFEVKSTNRGVLIPRLTVTQRKAILSPALGLMVFQTDGASGFYFYNGTVWQWLGGDNLTGLGENGQVTFWTGTGSLGSTDRLFWDNTNARLGIGTTSPGQSLAVHNGNVELTNNTLTSSEFRFFEPGFSGGSNYTAFKARPQSMDIIYTLPFADGSDNQALVTNGSGNLSWLTFESPLTFTNGLSRTDNMVKLGGNLIENTTITQDAGESLLFSNTGTGNTTINLASSGDFIIEDNGAAFFTATSGGRIGIGNSNPLQKLTVGGTFGLLEGGASPTHHTIFQGGVQAGDITYTLPVNNGNGGEMLTTDGSGILSWNIAESPLVFSNGLSRTGNAIKLGGLLSESTTIVQGSNSFTINNNGTANTIVNLSGTGNFRIENDGAAFFTATDGGNIGVGIASPAQKLTVNGTLGIMESSVPPVYSTILAGGNQTSDIYYSLPVNVGVNGQALVTDGVGMLRWETIGNLIGSGSAGKIPFWTSSNMLAYNSTFAWDNTNGRLGIGTTSPDQQLELTGNLMLPVTTAATGIIYAGTKPFIHNFGTRSIFLGKGAGNLTQSAAQDNIAIGDSSLLSLTNGDYNIAMGTSALRSLTSADGNTVIGYDAGMSIQTTAYNTIFGYRAGMHTTTDRSAFFGCEAGFSNTLGEYNTFLGHGAGHKNEEGNNCVAVGYKALFTQVGIGYSTDNTAVGFEAMYNCDQTGGYILNGTRNVAVGKHSLYDMMVGWSNTAIGTESGMDLTIGVKNVFVGDKARTHPTIQTDSSTAVGYKSYIAGGSCTAVGCNSWAMENFSTAIGSMAIADAVNSTAIGSRAEVYAANKIVIGNSSVATIGGYAIWSNYSDRRFKENITYRTQPGLDFVMKLKPASYNYIKDENKRRRDGLIAQDVQATLQELGIEFSGLVVDADKDSTLNLAYGEFVIPLINAVKEQQLTIAALQSQLERLMNDHQTILENQKLLMMALKKLPDAANLAAEK